METVSHVTRVPLPACHSSPYRRAGNGGEAEMVTLSGTNGCQEEASERLEDPRERGLQRVLPGGLISTLRTLVSLIRKEVLPLRGSNYAWFLRRGRGLTNAAAHRTTSAC